MAWPVLLVVGLLLLFAWPWGNRNTAELRDRYTQRPDLSRVAPGVFQTPRDGQRVFYIDRDSPDAIDARNVFILTHTARGGSVTTTKTGLLITEGADRYLELQRGQRNDMTTTGKRSLSSFKTYFALISENAAQTAEAKPPKTLDTQDLLRKLTLQTRPNSCGASACCWQRATFCCLASGCRPAILDGLATGICCSRCWRSLPTATWSTSAKPW